MKNTWQKSLIVMAFLLSFFMMAGPRDVRAQAATKAFTDAQEVLAIERMYENQRIDKQRELDAAKIQLAQCANEEAMVKNNVSAAKAGAKSQAVAGIFNSVGSSAGEWAKGISGLASNESADADATIRDVQSQIRRSNGIFTLNGKTVVSVNRTTAKTACLGEQGPKTTIEEANKLELRYCMYEHQNQATALSAQLKQAYADKANSGDLLSAGTQTAIGAGVGALGSHFQMKGADAQSKAELQNAALSRQQCELNAKNMIEDAQRGLTRIDNLKNQDLLNLTLRRKARDEQERLAAQDARSGGAGFAGPVDSEIGSGKGGSLNLGGAQNETAGGGAASGGGGGAGGGSGGGAGEASWGFGSGKGDMTGGGGLPPQPEVASYSSSDGGGGFGSFGDGASGDGNFSDGEQFGQDGAYYEEGEFVYGDGGLEVLLSRVGRRLVAHAGDLVKLPQQDMGVAKNPNGTATAPSTEDRQPSSAKPGKLDRL